MTVLCMRSECGVRKDAEDIRIPQSPKKAGGILIRSVSEKYDTEIYGVRMKYRLVVRSPHAFLILGLVRSYTEEYGSYADECGT